MAQFTITWSSLMSCFDPQPRRDTESLVHVDKAIGVWDFVKIAFLPVRLHYMLQAQAEGADIPKIPEDWFTSGYADKLECERYARELVGRLATLGVEVTDVPAEPVLSPRMR